MTMNREEQASNHQHSYCKMMGALFVGNASKNNWNADRTPHK